MAGNAGMKGNAFDLHMLYVLSLVRNTCPYFIGLVGELEAFNAMHGRQRSREKAWLH